LRNSSRSAVDHFLSYRSVPWVQLQEELQEPVDDLREGNHSESKRQDRQNQPKQEAENHFFVEWSNANCAYYAERVA
jgi:hypothetical protein